MSNFKKWIVILIIILLIIIGILGYAIYQNKAEVIYGVDESGDETEYKLETAVQKVSIRNDYYTVQTCVNKLYIYYASIYSTSTEQQKNERAQDIYNMLDTEYIKTREITKDNILSKLGEISSSKVSITKMYVSEYTENMSVYFVYGTLRNKKTSDISEFSLMVKLDKYNRTFSIFLQDYLEEKYDNIQLGDKIEFNYLKEIEKNDSNEYSYEAINDETYITDIFENFRDNMIYNKKIAYESLNEEYREKRFPNFEDFETYIKNNIIKIASMSLSGYQKDKYDNYTQYICTDNNNNYYIVHEETIMDYGFILDTYTLDLPQFIEKYENSEDEDKVALNLEKIQEAINNEDFQYVYNKLDNTFKNNNFNDYTVLGNYLKSNLFEENTFEYKNIEKKANVYVAAIHVINKKDSSEATKKMTVIMKLTDTTDYTMSFSFE